MGLLDNPQGLMGFAGGFLRDPSTTPQSTSGSFGRGLMGYQQASNQAQDSELKKLIFLAQLQKQQQYQQAAQQHMQLQRDQLTQQGLLQQAQISNYGRLADETARRSGVEDAQRQASGKLAGLLSPQGSFGRGTDMERPNAQVFTNDAEAISAMQQAEAKGLPFTGNVPNPSAVKSLAIQADPTHAIPELLRQQRPPLATTGMGARPVAGGYIQQGADGKVEFVQTRQDQAPVGTAGAGMMSPETLKFTAQQIIAGDRQAGQGYARSAPMKAALQNAVAAEAKEQGITGKDLAAIMSEYQGFTAGQRSVGTRQAQIEMAANVTKQFAPIAISASEGFDRTGIKTLNDLEKAVLSRTSSPELRKFNFANNALINAYARAINPTGVATVSDKDHAREILDTGFSKGDYKAAVDQLQVEIDAELKAPGAVKGDMRRNFTTPVSTSEVTAKSPVFDADKERRYQEWKARQGKP